MNVSPAVSSVLSVYDLSQQDMAHTQNLIDALFKQKKEKKEKHEIIYNI